MVRVWGGFVWGLLLVVPLLGQLGEGGDHGEEDDDQQGRGGEGGATDGWWWLVPLLADGSIEIPPLPGLWINMDHPCSHPHFKSKISDHQKLIFSSFPPACQAMR